jgi:hypothetical protein
MTRWLVVLIQLWLLLAPSPSRAEEPLRRLAVIAGGSQGGTGRVPLRYALSDARGVAGLLRQLGGVEADDLALLEEPDVGQLQAALIRAAAEAARAHAAGRRVELLLYYSGHSDEEGLLLRASRLPYADLRRSLDAVPAEVRVAILDSCASGAFTRLKGGVHRPPFLLDAASRVEGHAFLTSSAADEASQESDRLGASFFTHALLTGLRGAADVSGDGVVTLGEAYQFAFQETLARTETSRGGPQHATYDINLVGSGDVVLTDLRRAGATLVLPEGLAGRLFVRDAGGGLVAELRKIPGARVELALESGPYDVRLVLERRVSQGRVVLAPSDRQVLDERLLAPVALEATASRGEDGAGPETASPTSGPEGPREPGPAPALPRRHALTLGLGLLGLKASSSAGSGGVGSSAGGGLVELAYTRWLSQRLAFDLSVGWILASASSTVGAQGVGSEAATIVPLLVGASHYLPLAEDGALNLFGSVAAGAYLATATRSSAGLAGVQNGVEQQTVPGLRVGLGVEGYPVSWLRLLVRGGYHLLPDYRNVVGSHRNYSSLEVAFGVGIAWGR